MPPDHDLEDRIHRRAVTDGASVVEHLVRDEAPLLSPPEASEIAARVTARMVGLGPLEPLLADPDVSEVMVNGPGPVWIERAGALSVTSVVLDRATIEHLVERVVAPLGLRADRTVPVVDARLPDGSRVNVVIPPLAIDGPCLTIRRFGTTARSLASLCPPGVAALLAWAVGARCNVLISGGTGAGKTTLLNALAGSISSTERVITVEDAAELRLPGEHVVRLEARPASPDGLGAVRVRDLVRNSLRMRPDRIVIGEVRGGEALDMLQAMNTGHEGSLSTCHANSPADALRRIETMVLMSDVALPLAAVRDQVEASLDLVVQVARRPDGSRSVVEVAEVTTVAGQGRTRRLADDHGVRALPTRPARAAGSPRPDASWIVS
jgi:pilus assembly protein CpaF